MERDLYIVIIEDTPEFKINSKDGNTLSLFDPHAITSSSWDLPTRENRFIAIPIVNIIAGLLVIWNPKNIEIMEFLIKKSIVLNIAHNSF